MTPDDAPTTPLPRTSSSPSWADVPTTALSPAEVEAIGLTDTITQPLPAGSSAPDDAGTDRRGPHAPIRDADPDADAVWHGPIAPRDPDAPRGPNAPAIVWGLVLLTLAALIAAVVAGVRIDPLTAGIVLLAGLGVALLLTALLPRSRRESRTS